MTAYRTPLVAVLGAGGAVGGSAARSIADFGLGRIRVGGRRPGALDPVILRLGNRAEEVAVDAASPESLARFCAGSQVVVNCTGSHGEARSAAAEAALAAGAHYVDPGGDQELLSQLAGFGAAGSRCAVLGAGVLPGLSVLIPRWLAAGREPPFTLTAYMGTRDRMTLASAAEFLLSLNGTDGETQAMWRAGARISHALEPLTGTDLPFFPGEMVAYPYLSGEAERLARQLAADELRWYFVFEGDRVLTALSRLAERLRRGADLDILARELVQVVDVEMFGRTSAQQLVFQLDGSVSGRPETRVAVLRATSTYELTGTLTALAAAEVMKGSVPAGPGFAGEVLDPGVVGALEGLPGLAGLHVLDQPLPAYAQAVQGTV
jgi:Saccharopine dehydrogenase NADP binding domain